ncbi:MAG: helix-turn-helix transcriptional regulator [Evtepia sp.]
MKLDTVGGKIRIFRESQKIKQETFAEMVQLSPTYVSAIERGVKIPKLETFVRIVNTLGVSADALLAEVLEVRNEIVSSQLGKEISELPQKEQQRILNVVSVMVRDAKRESL